MLKNKKEAKRILPQTSFFPKNQKAQIGETKTWVVATIVIIVILLLSVYAAFALAKWKGFKIGELEIEEEEGLYNGIGYIQFNNGGKVLDTKTSLAMGLIEGEDEGAINDLLEEANKNE